MTKIKLTPEQINFLDNFGTVEGSPELTNYTHIPFVFKRTPGSEFIEITGSREKPETQLLGTDSAEYEILSRAAEQVKDVPGLICEIGTREGGSLQIIIDALVKTGQQRHVVSVDPYGNILYATGQPQLGTTRFDYTNDMKNRAMSALFEYVKGKPINLIAFTLEDMEFFNRFTAGVPVYSEEKTVINEYAFVFLDGPHSCDAIIDELDFFVPRMKKGSVIVLDDIEFEDMNHSRLEDYLFEVDFVVLEKGSKKASYIKRNWR